MGSFRVRGRAGVNRLPFRGRLRGRPLPSGTYRLLIGPAARARPHATIVVARGELSAARLREARGANACMPAIGLDWTGPSVFGLGPADGGAVQTSETSGKRESGENGVAAPLVSAAKGAVKEGKRLAGGAKQALEVSGPTSPLFLVALAMITLGAAGLTLLLFANVYRLRDRLYR